MQHVTAYSWVTVVYREIQFSESVVAVAEYFFVASYSYKKFQIKLNIEFNISHFVTRLSFMYSLYQL